MTYDGERVSLGLQLVAGICRADRTTSSSTTGRSGRSPGPMSASAPAAGAIEPLSRRISAPSQKLKEDSCRVAATAARLRRLGGIASDAGWADRTRMAGRVGPSSRHVVEIELSGAQGFASAGLSRTNPSGGTIAVRRSNRQDGRAPGHSYGDETRERLLAQLSWLREGRS